MDSSATLQGRTHSQIVLKECDIMFPVAKHTSSRRTPSFSSLSSFSSSSSSLGSSYYPEDSPLTPITPLRYSGVPFSWEHVPGIPKKQTSKKKESLMSHLPLPPPTTPTTSKRFNFDEKKKNSKETIEKDPFFAALVECSKDNDEEQSNYLWNSGGKVSRSISDRFGLINLYASCKRTCAISESIIYIPSSSSRPSFDLTTSTRLKHSFR